ncbi:MAG: ABC transporter substrate-binding protein [Deltaproteobacteria bacterium]|nr:ABC transporter substrate-binding protein [Deltaproteobacteria bacterium]
MRASRILMGLGLVLALAWPGGAQAGEPVEIIVAEHTVGTAGLPPRMIKALDLPAKYGLKLRYVPFTSAMEVDTAYALGKVTVHNSMNIIMGANVRQSRGFGVFVFPLQRAHNRIIARADAGITSLADLRGRRLGIFSWSAGEIPLAHELLREKGIDMRKDVEVKISPPPVLPAMLQKQQLDAALMFEPFGLRTLLAGGRLVVDLQQEWQRRTGQPLVFIFIAFDDRFAREQPQAVRSYLQMHLEAVRTMQGNPEHPVIRQFAEEMGFKTEAAQRAFRERILGLFLTEWNENILKATQDYLQLALRAGLIKAIPDGLMSTAFVEAR